MVTEGVQPMRGGLRLRHHSAEAERRILSLPPPSHRLKVDGGVVLKKHPHCPALVCLAGNMERALSGLVWEGGLRDAIVQYEG